MSTRIIKLLTLILVVAAIVSYIFYLNPAPVTVTWAKDQTVERPLAVILISVFCAGTIFASIFWSLLGVQYKLRDWRLSKERKEFADGRKALLEARSLIAAGDYPLATKRLQAILRAHPDDILARISLAECLRVTGDLRLALAVLDEARLKTDNPELLLLAAAINAELGNHTAEYDNLALIVDKFPTNSIALDRLVEASINANRLEEAYELQRQLIRHPGESAQSLHAKRQEQLARLEVLLAKKKYQNNPEALRSALEEVLRRHKEYAPALYELGLICREQVKLDEAVRYFSRSFLAKPEISVLEVTARTWLAVDDPQKALSAVRSLAYEKISPSELAISARIFLIALQLALGNLEGAVAERRLMAGVFGSKILGRSDIAVLDALILRKSQDAEEAFDMLFAACVGKESFQPVHLFQPNGTPQTRAAVWETRARDALLSTDQPPPRLLGS